MLDRVVTQVEELQDESRAAKERQRQIVSALLCVSMRDFDDPFFGTAPAELKEVVQQLWPNNTAMQKVVGDALADPNNNNAKKTKKDAEVIPESPPRKARRSKAKRPLRGK